MTQDPLAMGAQAASPNRATERVDRSMLDTHCTSDEIAEAKPTMAVLGIGAIEQHGHHLPVGTDWLTVRELARRVAEGLGAYLLPPLPFSMSQCHGTAAGTVWLRPQTLAAVVRDVALSLHSQGIHRVVLLNGHGGNFVLEAVVQELNLTRTGLSVVMPSPEAAFGEPPIFEAAGIDIHAGEAETSYQLYLNPDHVAGKRADCIPPVGREFLDYVVMNVLSPRGVWGRPSLGSAEKGRQAMEAWAEAIVEHTHRLFAELNQRNGTSDVELA